MRTLIATVLLILAAAGCTQQRDTGEKESTEKLDLKTPGWTPSGRFDEYYSKYSGSGLASGTAIITWEESVSESPPSEGLLYFNPDNESRLKYPILNEFIDIPLSKETLLALGLPQKAPQGVNDCGFKVQATLVLSEYFKFDMEASDSGNDTSDIAAVVKSSPPKTVKCSPENKKVSNAEI